MWGASSQQFDADVAGYSGRATSYDDTANFGDTGIMRLLLSFTIPADLQTLDTVTLRLNCNTALGGNVRVFLSSATTPLGDATNVNTTLHDSTNAGTIDTSTTGAKSIAIPNSWITGAAGGQLVICIRENAYDPPTTPAAYVADVDTSYGGEFDVSGDTNPPYLELTY